MKRLILFLSIFIFIMSCTIKQSLQAADLKMLENSLQNDVSKNNKDIKVKVKELKNLKDILPGFSFVEIGMYDKGTLVNKENVITNGQFYIKDILDIKTSSSIKDELEFEFAKVETIDTSKLTLVAGNKNAKNVVIEITDFQCPYCKKANVLLEQQLNNRNDYALYIIHLPLDMHPNAQTMARVFEAGMVMGYNFKNDLFQSDYIETIETKALEMQKKGIQLNKELVDKLIEEVNTNIINDFAIKTNNADKFKSLVDSKEIKDKIEYSMKLANSLKVDATPYFYINGKSISGYKKGLITKAINSFK